MATNLSTFFNVAKEDLDAEGVFDAFIDLDSQLHVDPHLLDKSSASEMVEAAATLSTYFSDTIALIQTCSEKKGTLWNAVVTRLTFPELGGVSLGYSAADADGSAVGPVLAAILASRAFDIVKAGETNPRIFELVGLFTDDFGPDRISDVVLRICEKDFAKYTARVAATLNLPVSSANVGGIAYSLPMRDAKPKAKPLFLVPKDVLRDLPVALDRSEIAAVAAYNNAIRQRINDLFASVGKDRAPKETLWHRIKGEPKLMQALVEAYLAAGGSPYDFSLDPAAEGRRYIEAQQMAVQFPLKLEQPKGGWTPESALKAVLEISNHFKKLVEANGLWDSFWVRKKKPVKTLTEHAMQRIFLAITLTYCRGGSPDLDISPETNAGPGPVDFKFSHGAGVKVTLEMKKSNHERLVHGYETQLPLYNAAESTATSVFLVIRLSDDTDKIDRVKQLRTAALKRGEIAPEIVIVDARPQQSASKPGAGPPDAD
jgi:hypothetical protein